MHSVQQVAYFTMAQILLQVQEKFKNDPKFDGWFTRWVDEATPLSKAQVDRLLPIAKAARENPEIVDLTKKYSHSAAAIISKLPSKVRTGLVSELVKINEVFTTEQLQSINESPEVELERAEELVQQLQITIAGAQLKAATAGSAQDRGNAKQQVKKSQTKLELALQRLSEARAKVNDLEKQRTSQDIIEEVLRKQIRAQQVQIEEANLDPEAKRKRAIARTVVDASNGLDLLLQSLDKYDLDKEELGEEAVRMLEKKMALVKSKLVKMSRANAT
jgi:hypothetical protein